VRALMVLIKDGEWKREEMVKGFKKVKVWKSRRMKNTCCKRAYSIASVASAQNWFNNVVKTLSAANGREKV
jgi:hypothetical protein